MSAESSTARGSVSRSKPGRRRAVANLGRVVRATLLRVTDPRAVVSCDAVRFNTHPVLSLTPGFSRGTAKRQGSQTVSTVSRLAERSIWNKKPLKRLSLPSGLNPSLKRGVNETEGACQHCDHVFGRDGALRRPRRRAQRQATERMIRIARLRQRVPPAGTRARTSQRDVPTFPGKSSVELRPETNDPLFGDA